MTTRISLTPRHIGSGVRQQRLPRRPKLIAVLPAPARPLLVKRVVALAGDPVPPEVREAAGAAEGALVPAGQLVALGDNPAFSTDSRFRGTLPARSVVGVGLELGGRAGGEDRPRRAV
ncbi:S26 family signal peptidase [Streptomyces sp. NPDC059814]|uniref:S26 family signal peptidase n=1 Tax=Streptomyces sp. NPDC059814 TaxID=3346959 RepID=UPI00365CEDD1